MPAPRPRGEDEALVAHHRFLWDDDETPSSSYGEQVARKYYDSLYKEYAIANLKHYRTRGVALRWRTESEVLDGTGQVTCANQRCSSHTTETSRLATWEVPFTYEERGARGVVAKEALVKLVLCPHCSKKMHAARSTSSTRPKRSDA